MRSVFQVQDRARVNLIDIYSQARIYHLDHMTICKKITELKSRLPKRTPYYVTTFLNGYSDALTAQLYHESLEFCYVMPNGELASTYKKSPRYYETIGYKVYELTDRPHSFYYIGTDKAY